MCVRECEREKDREKKRERKTEREGRRDTYGKYVYICTIIGVCLL